MTRGGIQGELSAQYVDAVNYWKILEQFEYYLTWPIADATTAEKVVVPVGFLTDFASVPAWGRVFIHPSMKIAKPAAIHDKLYTAPVIHVGTVSARPCTKEDADRIFLDAMTVVGVSWWQRMLAYHSVRIGGGPAWRSARDRDRDRAFL